MVVIFVVNVWLNIDRDSHKNINKISIVWYKLIVVWTTYRLVWRIDEGRKKWKEWNGVIEKERERRREKDRGFVRKKKTEWNLIRCYCYIRLKIGSAVTCLDWDLNSHYLAVNYRIITLFSLIYFKP